MFFELCKSTQRGCTHCIKICKSSSTMALFIFELVTPHDIDDPKFAATLIQFNFYFSCCKLKANKWWIGRHQKFKQGQGISIIDPSNTECIWSNFFKSPACPINKNPTRLCHCVRFYHISLAFDSSEKQAHRWMQETIHITSIKVKTKIRNKKNLWC